jgi:hypothetical protein
MAEPETFPAGLYIKRWPWQFREFDPDTKRQVLQFEPDPELASQ